MCGNGHTKEGTDNTDQDKSKNDRKIKDINKEITDADNVAHQTGQDNTYARRKRQNAETVKEEDTMKRCAVPRKESNTSKKQRLQQKKTTGITTEYKEKTDFYNATLFVNSVPIKFIIDSGSPVTLISECLSNDITTNKPLKTTYKDVNNQRIEFTGQTNALVKTNKQTIELPLLITKAKTSPLMGLDWMQRLKFNLSSNNEAIQIHNIKLDNTDKKILKLQNDFKDLFYNNEEIKNLSVKVQLEEGAQIKQQNEDQSQYTYRTKWH